MGRAGLGAGLWLCACRPASTTDDTGSALPATPPSAEEGWEVLRYGSYIGSGVPAEVWFDLVPADPTNLLDRTGQSADLPVAFNLFTAPNGVEVVGGITCTGCHSGTVDGTWIVGLGNPRAAFTDASAQELLTVLEGLVEAKYGADSPEVEAYTPFARGSAAVLDAGIAPFVGVNPAFSIERAAAAHRDPVTLAWSETPLFEIPAENLWSDTPAWWNLRKRSTLYWTGFGTGPVEKLLMQISVVGITDVAQAEEILGTFDDVRAWITSLEPPPYPLPVDEGLAAAGETVFLANCAACHGTYGEGGAYTEQVVPADVVGTDSVYAEGFNGAFLDWLAESWFASGPASGTTVGYVPPPLDGVWATAPYLHNGSVPDLASLLDPTRRPTWWRRDPVDTSLDHDTMGWPYTVPAEDALDVYTYDTRVRGAGNGGHTYAATLSDADREALLAYLKTL